MLFATETKHLHWLLGRSTLAPYALAFASCLCGSPSIDTSLQQPHISLLGHSGSYKATCLGAAAAYTEPEEEAEMLQPTLRSTARAQAGGLRQAGPPPWAEGMWQEAQGREDPAQSTTHPA